MDAAPVVALYAMSFEAPDREEFYVFSDEYGTKNKRLHFVCDARSQHEGVQKARSLPTWHLYQPHTGEAVYVPRGQVQPVRVPAERGWGERVLAALPDAGRQSTPPVSSSSSAFHKGVRGVMSVLFNNQYAALAE